MPSTSCCAAAARVSAASMQKWCPLTSTSRGSAPAITCSRSRSTRRQMPASRASIPRQYRCESPVQETDVPRLFGTDGVRGTAGEYPLDHATVRRLGAALVRALPRAGAAGPRLLVGRDTRESGGWIEAELAHGATQEGAQVTSAGVVPTPAGAYLTRTEGYDAGVVISASHNPFEDNGIKVFSGRGEKFTEVVERQIEAIVADPGREDAPARSGPLGPGAGLLTNDGLVA